MDFEQFQTDLQAALDRSREPLPRLFAYLKTRAEQMRHDIPAAIYSDIVSGVLDRIAPEYVALTESGGLDLAAQNRLAAQFDSRLLAAIQKERAHGGRLHPWSADEEIKDNIGLLMDSRYNSVETTIIRQMLQEGERLTVIGPREIQTSAGRTITRDDFLPYCPRGVWPSQFKKTLTPESALQELENEAAARKRAAEAPKYGTWEQRDPG